MDMWLYIKDNNSMIKGTKIKNHQQQQIRGE